MKNHVLYFTKPYTVLVQSETVPVPKPGEILVKNYISAISSGTEFLFYSGLMPDDIPSDMSIPALKQKNFYPIKYGYSSVGKIVDSGNKEDNHLIDKWVFSFNPHESYFCTKTNELILLPEDISPRNAIFIPNMETAINLILDGRPLIGENVLVLGLGIVGLLTTSLLQQFPIAQLLGVDFYPSRCALGKQLGADMTFNANHENWQSLLNMQLAKNNIQEIDLIYELTGNPEAINTAIDAASYESRIVLGSWYGKKPGMIHLGGKFHRSRIQIIASQVSSIASKLQGRWTKNRRFETVFNMLRKLRPEHLISHSFHITEAEKAYQLLASTPQETLQLTFTYEE